MIEYLRDAVVVFDWAHKPISDLAAGSKDFELFHANLKKQLNLQKNAERRSRLRYETNAVDSTAADDMTTWFQRYGRNPRDARKYDGQPRSPSRWQRGRPPGPSQDHRTRRGDTRRPQLSFEEARQLSLCHGCHKPWTRGHDCEQRKAFRLARARLRSDESSVHVVEEVLDVLQQTPAPGDEVSLERVEGLPDDTYFAGPVEKELNESFADPEEEDIIETNLAEEWD